jgi:hypothetical protein
MKALDTRDLYKRKCELESLRDAVTTAETELDEAVKELAAFDPDRPDVAPDDEQWYEKKEELETAVTDAESNLEVAEFDFGDDEKAELDELETLENEISEFMHGETMILEDDFEDYVREMAEDIHGKAVREATWPFNCIDWAEAAEQLQQDYSTVEYQGKSYYVRS